MSPARFRWGILLIQIGVLIMLANLDVMFNVKIQKNILHVLKGEARVDEILVPIEKNLVLIPLD